MRNSATQSIDRWKLRPEEQWSKPIWLRKSENGHKTSQGFVDLSYSCLGIGFHTPFAELDRSASVFADGGNEELWG